VKAVFVFMIGVCAGFVLADWTAVPKQVYEVEPEPEPTPTPAQFTYTMQSWIMHRDGSWTPTISAITPGSWRAGG